MLAFGIMRKSSTMKLRLGQGCVRKSYSMKLRLEQSALTWRRCFNACIRHNEEKFLHEVKARAGLHEEKLLHEVRT